MRPQSDNKVITPEIRADGFTDGETNAAKNLRVGQPHN